MGGADRARAAGTFFDDVWRGCKWSEAPLAGRRLDRMIELVADRRYRRALEVGCGDGSFSRRLAAVADEVLGLDLSEEAIARARDRGEAGVDYRVADAVGFAYRDHGPWDLVVVGETLPYVGWLHTFFEVGWLARELFELTTPGGRALLVDARRGAEGDWLYRPWLIRTYHDLFRNAGYRIEHEEVLAGEADGVEVDFLLTLYDRPA